MKKAIFLDKDGTLVEDVPYNVNPALIRLAPGALEKRGREGRTMALKIIGEFTVNPVLTFALETGHGRQIDPDRWK